MTKNTDEMGNIYGYFQIAPDTWCITNRWQNFMYLLCGRKKAMLIDTGSGEGNIREIVEKLTDKPVFVVNTHGHFDHSGGNSCWQEVWMAKEAAEHAKEPFTPMHREWFMAQPWPDYEIHELTDGMVIELGEREVEVISIPAHSEGSLAFLDRNTRYLFSGDELESGQVIWFVRNEAVPLQKMAEEHRKNMEKLKARRSEYDWIWPAHNGAPLYPDAYLQDFIELDEMVMKGEITPLSHTAGFGFPTDTQAVPNPFQKYGALKRLEHGVASVVYSPGESIYHNGEAGK